MIEDLGPIPGSGKIPWRWEWRCTPVFLPKTSHGQRRLAGYSPRGRKESDTAEQREHIRNSQKSVILMGFLSHPRLACILT